jgi:protein-L-isoaspartate(D-aspartate) O-methyltransferase
MGKDIERGRALLYRDLISKGIGDDRVLQAMEKVPRHLFVPEALRHLAYSLQPVPIGMGQTISTPYIVASMTELLELEGDEKVLEIGAGCGYQTAVLCETAGEVHSLEIIPEVAELGRENLRQLGYKASLSVGDGSLGLPKHAPFDRILIAASAPYIPGALLDQLGEGGILVAPVERGEEEELVRYRNTASGLVSQRLYGVRFVPMTGQVRRR